MTAERLRSYRFATAAQWRSCLMVQADRDPRGGPGGLRPFPPYARPGTLFETRGAHAPAVTRGGETLWSDGAGRLHRIGPCDDAPTSQRAPRAIARAARLVATPSGLWVASEPPESLQRFEEDSLTRLLAVAVPQARVVDIAGDGRDAIVGLAEGDGGWRAVRIDRTGRPVESVALLGIASATALVFLRRSRRLVVAGGESQQRLYWFAAEGGAPLFSIAIAAMRPCFTAEVLGSDGRERVFLAGADGYQFGGGAYVLDFDADGDLVGELPLDPRDAPVTGLAATRGSLFVTGPRGLLRFDAAASVPEGAGQVRTMVMTPALDSPDREDGRRWLRAEASANLPAGTTLEISFAATDDQAVRDRLNAVMANRALPASQRLRQLLEEPGLRRGRTEFQGATALPAGPRAPFAAKLFDVAERYLWVHVALSAAPGAPLPELSQLAVLYPGRTLMEHLPAIYQQRSEAQPNAFVRDLVGVFEATTHDLDRSIAAMGSRVHPATAPERWLDFIARWLGVPWDDALSGDQKRSLITGAAELARGRGTRAGLEALLDGLIPDRPRRFRVIDATADLGFATVGGDGCAGTALPALLGGRTRWSPELDTSAVLGVLRLPCAGQLDDGAWQLAGRVRVEVAATAEERRAWEPWLNTLITEMVPLTARVELRWVSTHALESDRLDGTLTLRAAPAAHLGTDAVTGLACLPERGIRLSPTGADLGTRLR